MIPKTIPHTKSVTEIKQTSQMKELSIAKLMTQYMNEEKQRATMFFEEQQRSLPTILEENPEKEDIEHTEAISLMSGRELKEPIKGERCHEVKRVSCKRRGVNFSRTK